MNTYRYIYLIKLGDSGSLRYEQDIHVVWGNEKLGLDEHGGFRKGEKPSKKITAEVHVRVLEVLATLGSWLGGNCSMN